MEKAVLRARTRYLPMRRNLAHGPSDIKRSVRHRYHYYKKLNKMIATNSASLLDVLTRIFLCCSSTAIRASPSVADRTSEGILQARQESEVATSEMPVGMPPADGETEAESMTGSASSSSTPMGRRMPYCHI